MGEIVLRYPGQIVGKARPRVTSNGTYMPHKYAIWKSNAALDIAQDFAGMTDRPPLPLPVPVRIDVKMHGKFDRRTDGDNALGAVLDALQAAEVGNDKVLRQDNLKNVVAGSFELDYSKANPFWTLTITWG